MRSWLSYLRCGPYGAGRRGTCEDRCPLFLPPCRARDFPCLKAKTRKVKISNSAHLIQPHSSFVAHVKAIWVLISIRCGVSLGCARLSPPGGYQGNSWLCACETSSARGWEREEREKNYHGGNQLALLATSFPNLRWRLEQFCGFFFFFFRFCD